MQMDMQEPGEMYCCCWEEHDLVMTQRVQTKTTDLNAGANHIIVSKFPV
jgi:hypothetical protein